MCSILFFIEGFFFFLIWTVVKVFIEFLKILLLFLMFGCFCFFFFAVSSILKLQFEFEFLGVQIIVSPEKL